MTGAVTAVTTPENICQSARWGWWTALLPAKYKKRKHRRRDKEHDGSKPYDNCPQEAIVHWVLQ